MSCGHSKEIVLSLLLNLKVLCKNKNVHFRPFDPKYLTLFELIYQSADTVCVDEAAPSRQLGLRHSFICQSHSQRPGLLGSK
jgi:hypothetical protein